MERVLELKLKLALSTEDALFVLQLIQQQTTPILSLRSSATSLPAKGQTKSPSLHNDQMLQHEGLGGVTVERAIERQGSDLNHSDGGYLRKDDSSILDITSLDDFPSLSLQESINDKR